MMGKCRSYPRYVGEFGVSQERYRPATTHPTKGGGGGEKGNEKLLYMIM